MPGRDITRLRNRAARVLFLFMLVILAGGLLEMPAGSQSAPSQTENKAAGVPPAATAPQSDAPAQAQDKKKKEDQDINDQGVFVIRKDVDEVLLHASVVDDK